MTPTARLTGARPAVDDDGGGPERADASPPVLSPGDVATLAMRVAMEVGIVLALGYWGFHAGHSTAARLVLGLGAPAVGFGFWGAVDFRRAGRCAEPLRLVQELLISLAAAGALLAAGQPLLGWALAALSLIYHGVVCARGDTLLDRTG